MFFNFLYLLFSFTFALPLSFILGTKFARMIAKIWGKFLVFLSGSKIELVIKDKEDFEKTIKENAVVLVGNHQSYFDIPVLLAYFPKDIGFVAKKELEKVPFIGSWMKAIKCVFLDRSNPREGIKSIKDAVEKIKTGYSVVIFPEGTRSDDGEVGEFKKGSFKIATDSGVKILPISLKGTIDMHRKGENLVRKAKKVEIIVDKSIDPSQLEREEIKHLSETIRNIIINNYKNA